MSNWLKQAEELTEHSWEYKFLLLLVKVLGQEGIPKEEVMAVINAKPIKTTDDVDDITRNLWRLGLEHGIPKDYLIKKLPDSKIK